MKRLALALIAAYKRWISPHKGYACASRVLGGRRSCSSLGARLIRRHGLWRGLALLRARTRRCAALQRWHRPLAAQRGDCDCGGCDLPDLDCKGLPWDCACDACDLLDLCGNGKKREQRRQSRALKGWKRST